MPRDIRFHPNVSYPDISSSSDVNEKYQFSNNAFDAMLNKLLGFEPESGFSLNHPLYGNVDKTEKTIRDYKENPRCVVSFPCEAGKPFTGEDYGAFGNQQPPKKCPEDGVYSFDQSYSWFYPPVNPLQQQLGKAFRDIFGKAKKRSPYSAQLPNITLQFQGQSSVELDVIYIANFYIGLNFSCDNESVDVLFPAFLNTEKKPCSEAVFYITKKSDNDRLRITHVFQIEEETILERTRIEGSRNPRNLDIYEFTPIAGKKTPPALLKEGEFVPVSPLSADDFEPSVFDNDPDTPEKGYPDNCKPNFGFTDPASQTPPKLLTETQKKANVMLRRYLSDRITQLQSTVDKELAEYAQTGILYNGQQTQMENCQKALDLLQGCNTKIRVMEFHNPVNPPNAAYHGLIPLYDAISDELDIKQYIRTAKLSKINTRPNFDYERDIYDLFN
jgi:hypothetical protein